MKKKVAVITGIAGQDGAYLADFLLKKGYHVVGVTKSTESDGLWRLEYFKILSKIISVHGNITDLFFIDHLIKKYQPNEFYNLAGQSRVGRSWDDPTGNFEANTLAVINLLEVIRQFSPRTRFFQASSAEMYGEAKVIITEKTASFAPINPYGLSKLAAHLVVDNYRQKYNLFACSGILFNHESPLRESDVVTKKIVHGVASIYAGLAKKIELGDIEIVRDWGFAGDFVEAIWRMLRQKQPQDLVICTGQSLPIKDFIQEAFLSVGIRNWQQYVKSDPAFFRKLEIRSMRGSNKEIRRVLGWQPKTSFKKLVRIMVNYELEKLKNEDQ